MITREQLINNDDGVLCADCKVFIISMDTEQRENFAEKHGQHKLVFFADVQEEVYV